MASIVKQYPRFKDLVNAPDLNIKASLCLGGTLIQGVIKDSEDVKIKMHQNVVLVPALDVQIKRYIAMVGYNPELDNYGFVNCQPLLFKGESPYIIFKAKKDMDLSSLEYVFRIVLID